MISEIKDVFDKINKDRFLVGLDLNDSFAQISVCKIDSDNPSTLSYSEGSEDFNVPLSMLKRRSDGAWLYGKDAENAEDEGILIKDFFEKARLGKTIRIDREEYLAKDIFLLFVKKVLLLFPVMATPDKISSITVTLKDAEPESIALLQDLPSIIKVNPEIIHFITYEESMFYYMLYQSQELQNHNILLFDTSGERLRSYVMMRNLFQTPRIATVDVNEYVNFPSTIPSDYEKSDRDKLFLTIAKELCNQTIFSGVFLIGEAFYSDWASESLQFLCKGRRVFKGNNLFSKGACLAAKEKVNPSGRENSIRFFGKDRLKFSIGVETNDNPSVKIPLIEAGIQWFEASGRTELILKDTEKIGLYISYINNNNIIKADLTLQGLFSTNDRITRVSMEVKMTAENTVHFKVSDLGFGEIFRSSGKEWEQELNLEG